MISDLAQAHEFVNLARGLGDFRVGIMLETPQIAKSVSQLRGLLDFVSVGTNDLSQYFFNLDRYSPENAEQINYWHPAFVLLLEEIAKAAKEAGISAGVCGESAADPEFGIVLAGLGFDSLSVSVSSLSSVRSALTSASLKQAQSLARLAVSVKSAAAAQAIVRSELSRLGLES
jgi:phosphotransferase system enzyme I (PtsI)